jgi:hypothetical protein
LAEEVILQRRKRQEAFVKEIKMFRKYSIVIVLIVSAVLVLVFTPAAQDMPTPPVMTPYYLYEVTQTATPAAQIPEATPTQTVPTQQAHYKQVVHIETDRGKYGSYVLTISIELSPVGYNMNAVQDAISEEAQTVKSVCPFSSLVDENGAITLARRDNDAPPAMTNDCWDLLESISGRELVHSNSTYGNAIVVDCTGQIVCSFYVGENNLPSLGDDSFEHLLESPDGIFYAIVSSYAWYDKQDRHVTGDEFIGIQMPTDFRIPLNQDSYIPKLGVSWIHDTGFVYTEPASGYVGEGEYPVPGGSNHGYVHIAQIPITAVYAHTEEQPFLSWGWIDQEETIYGVYSWYPEVQGRDVVIHIYGTQIMQLFPVLPPRNIGSNFRLDQYSFPATDYSFGLGEKVKILEELDSYQWEAVNTVSGWNSLSWRLEGLKVLRGNGDIVVFTTGYQFCKPHGKVPLCVNNSLPDNSNFFEVVTGITDDTIQFSDPILVK